MAIKRISVKRLKPSMYVSDLNSDWIPHGPKNKSGRVVDEEQISEIEKLGIRYVYIDTDRGPDDNEGQDEREVAEEREKLYEEASELSPTGSSKVGLELEMGRAIVIHEEAKEIVNQAFNDVRRGKMIDIDSFNHLSLSLVESVFRNQDALATLGRIRKKDRYLMEHSVNLSVLMSTFGKSKEIDKDRLQHFSVGALLHDVGKIMIPDEILHKPGKLTDEEFTKMKMHATYGKQMLKGIEGISELAVEVAAQHHERIDGTGYPLGLKGDEISEHGKMVAIVDVYDAITADRCYHKAMPPASALKKLLEWSGTHFDPSLVREFIRTIGIHPVGSVVQLRSDRVGIVTQQNEKDQRLPVVKIFYNLKHKHYTKVEDLDLSKPYVQDRIAKAIDPIKMGINIEDFLDQ